MANIGSWNDKKVMHSQLMVGEVMMGGMNLINSEVLYYVLKDVIGLDQESATAMALKVHNGGKKVSPKSVSIIFNERTHHGLYPRQATRFMKHYMRSTRINQIDENPSIWQMNGFSTEEPPYIAGFERQEAL